MIFHCDACGCDTLSLNRRCVYMQSLFGGGSSLGFLGQSETLSLWFCGGGVKPDEWLCCRLWIMTVNALRPSAKLLRQQTYTQNDLMVDPLIVLRCDQRVYR